ncbi:MAG: hypothetical protein K1Y36_18265 [Blastocatellia bacterium]|nr:hypothetical protein [Blastocatellia bacterium]
MTNLIDRFSDALNPIVVKELRQAVQSKFVSGGLTLLLVVQLAAVGIYVLNNDNPNDFSSGRQMFLVLEAFLLGFSLLFVPAYTAIRMVAERSDTNVDLLFITTIKPISIVWGKFLAALVIAGLIFSACLPFLTFTYFLRGIDLPTIFLLLLLAFSVVVSFVQLSIFLACLPVGKIFRIILGLLLLGAMFPSFVGTIAFSEDFSRRGVSSQLLSFEFWGPFLSIGLVLLMAIGTLFTFSVALITPASANRALPVRLFLTISWVVSGIVCLALSKWVNEMVPVGIWAFLFFVIFANAFFASVSEREELGRRVLRSIPKNPVFRPFFFSFYSGAASGLVWSLGLVLLTVGICAAWHEFSGVTNSKRNFREMTEAMFGLCLYAFCYALLASNLRRLVLRKMNPENTWALGYILVVLGCFIPPIVGFLLSMSSRNKSVFLLNPFAFAIVDDKSMQNFFWIVLGCWTALMLVVNSVWLIRQYLRFKPLPPPSLYVTRPMNPASDGPASYE